MIPIIIFGERKNDDFSVALKDALKKNGGFFHITENSISQEAESIPKYLLIESNDITSFATDKTVFVFCGSVLNLGIPEFPENSTMIFDSQNTNVAKLLEHTGSVAISCGLSLRDTLNLASIGDGCAVVSVQRELITLDGETSEQRDIKLLFDSEIKAYPILAIAAILLLSSSGKVDIFKI